MAIKRLCVPERIFAGDTELYTRRFADYPASAGWGYKLYVAGASVFNIAGAPNGDDFDVTILSTDTVALVAGSYRYIERVKKSTEEHTVGQGVIDVLLNLATASAGQAQSHEELTLTVIEAALSGRMTSDVQSYMIAGRSVVKIPIAELMQMKGYYRAIIERQRTGEIGRTVEVTFGEPSTSPDMTGFPGIPPWQ